MCLHVQYPTSAYALCKRYAWQACLWNGLWNGTTILSMLNYGGSYAHVLKGVQIEAMNATAGWRGLAIIRRWSSPSSIGPTASLSSKHGGAAATVSARQPSRQQALLVPRGALLVLLWCRLSLTSVLNPDPSLGSPDHPDDAEVTVTEKLSSPAGG